MGLDRISSCNRSLCSTDQMVTVTWDDRPDIKMEHIRRGGTIEDFRALSCRVLSARLVLVVIFAKARVFKNDIRIHEAVVI